MRSTFFIDLWVTVSLRISFIAPRSLPQSLLIRCDIGTSSISCSVLCSTVGLFKDVRCYIYAFYFPTLLLVAMVGCDGDLALSATSMVRYGCGGDMVFTTCPSMKVGCRDHSF